MARRRGFFAELQHQNKVAARKYEQAQRAAVREHEATVRRAEQARKQAERSRAQVARASEAERKRAEQDAHRLHVEAMDAEAARLNAELAEVYDQIDSLLAATLEVDDFVDLETLRQVAKHPPFDRTDLEQPVPPPPPLVAPPEPAFESPSLPRGLSRVFGKKKHAEALAAAQSSYEAALAAWQAEVAQVPARQLEQANVYEDAERKRLQKLAAAQKRYEDEGAEREREVAEENAALDELIAGLAYGTGDAIQEYVSIVLSNSVYPESFPVEHEFDFDAQHAELSLRALLPAPREVPGIKAYKYAKSSDSITSTELSQKQRKDRYTGAVHQVALRLLHEIFEADRRGFIKTISLELGTNTTDPATGKRAYVPFVAVTTARETFMDIDLSAVVPLATLQHLGAVVSKNPFGLVAINASGVRST